MFQPNVEAVIRRLWSGIERHGGYASAAEAINLQGSFGLCGSICKNLLQPDDVGEQALRKVLDTLIGSLDDWRICCHEAGHAIVGVKLQIVWERIVRGQGTKGVVELFHDPDDCGDKSQYAKYQLFYAAGAAAERLVFGTEARTFDNIVKPLADDKKKHQSLEYRHRLDGFEADVLEAVGILKQDGGKNHIEDIAALLKQRRDEDGKEGQVTQDEVAAVIGVKLSWT